MGRGLLALSLVGVRGPQCRDRGAAGSLGHSGRPRPGCCLHGCGYGRDTPINSLEKRNSEGADRHDCSAPAFFGI
jgi:hypothetical protein